MQFAAKAARARIEAIAGPLQGRSFSLTGAVTIGRAQDNIVSLDDRSVSRRHCSIEPAGGGFRLFDRGSANQTRINGVVAFDRPLAHGDEIEIGLSRFVYIEEGGEETPVVENDIRMDSTVIIKPGEVRLPQPDSMLNALLRAANRLPSAGSAEALSRLLLETSRELVPADHLFVLLPSPDGSEIRQSFSLPPQGGSVSRSVIRQVLSTGSAVVANLGDTPVSSDSFAQAKVNSVAAAPIEAAGRVIGVLYAGRAIGRFDEHHLGLLVALAGLAAGPLHSRELLSGLEAETRRLRAEIALANNMVGNSPRMESVYQFIARVARTDSTVLIQGESGTGKELVARAIHSNSPRAAGPFVAVNCAALTETLLESELFGHEKGAFTGAIAQRKGRLEEAEGGTFFLDEVGEMPLTIQAKLLRVLQEREFQRLGGSRTLRANVRVVAATNRNLDEASQNKEFRADLLYRLKVVSIDMPSLRDRREDIESLVRHFIRKHSDRVKRPVAGVSADALACLRNYDWPGNVRELENAIERAIVLGLAPEVQTEDLPESIAERGSRPVASGGGIVFDGDYHAQVHEAKREIVRRALAEAPTLAEAARRLGLHPNNLHRLVTNLGLRDERT
jgi:Nif-specific regulatory protein